MALYSVRVTLGRSDADPVQWGFGFDMPSEPTSSALADFLVAIDLSEDALRSQLTLAAMTLDMAEAFPAAGGPAVAVFSTGGDLSVGGGTPGNADVALAVSMHVATPRGSSPRGRVYLGPFSSANVGQTRPGISIQTGARKFVSDILQGGEANGWEPVVISRREGGAERPSPVGLPIIALSTDDAWDTQRRRGHEPTQRVVETYPITDEGSPSGTPHGAVGSG